jgi:GAF domain-containing protein
MGGPGAADKAAEYEAAHAQLASVLEGCPDFVAALASTAALLKDTFPQFFWVGFYLPEPDGALRVGPYQGPLACLRLPPGQGVCGAVASTRETRIVPDVHAFPGHIACDPRSRSEIVVPVLRGGELIAVLDIDSDQPDAFDEADCEGLEKVAHLVAAVS